MPTTNQLILGAQQRLPKKRMRDKKTPALQGSPQKRGVCLRVYTKTPKKPKISASLKSISSFDGIKKRAEE